MLYWILVGVAIWIGLAFAPYIIAVAIWALVILVPIAIVAALYLWRPDDVTALALLGLCGLVLWGALAGIGNLYDRLRRHYRQRRT